MSEVESILVIEDDADVLRAARIALTSHVGHIEIASDPSDVGGRLEATLFEAVLLDMNFVHGEYRGSEGLNVLGRIRACDPSLAVVLMTAYGGVALAVEALKQGAVDFILKPWRNDKLVAAVIAAASITRSRRAAESLDLETLERRAIEQALAQSDGNISQAATVLGLSRAALYRRMSKHGLG
jgi:DNA-binding NtrC family response regulator